MAQLLIALLIGATVLLNTGCEKNPDAQKYIDMNTPQAQQQEEVEEDSTESNSTTTLNDYINLRTWFDVGDGEDGITYDEAVVLNIKCKQNEDFKMFEEALGDESIYTMYPELND